LYAPETIILWPLPPAAAVLNPVERVWLYLHERYLPHCVLDNYDAVPDAAYRA
jgi:transposase